MDLMFRRVAAVVLAAILLLGAGMMPAEAKAKAVKKKASPYHVTARAALLMEGDGWPRTLYEKDAGRKVYPASTTKIMTALIVLERLPLDRYVTVGKHATQTVPSIIGIKEGERYKVRDLIYAILLNSANDASIALAEAVAGSESKFVAMMNRRAKQLGARNTLFANAHGLPSDDDPQYTTASDMVLMFREAMKKAFFREVINQKVYILSSEAGRKISLRSHNKMLFKGWKQQVFGKTGYTRAALSCFVGYVEKKGRRLYIAVFGCAKRWDDIKYIIETRGKVDL
jgi:D-alanyl-D-alanine carboxypeptidase (penicillin-binding protein 5/6)